MRDSRLLNYALYQAGWFACVLGAAAHRPWTGALVAMTLTGVHLALARERGLEVRLMARTSVAGVIVETAQIAAGTYQFTSGTIAPALPPVWMIVLWMQFATTFRSCGRPVVSTPGRAALFGALGGPAAFLVGARLGAVSFLQPLPVSLLSLALGWAASLYVCALLLRHLEARGHTSPASTRAHVSPL